MPRKARIALIVVAALLMLFALAALIYALMPNPLLRDTIPVLPTLLVPPGGAP